MKKRQTIRVLLTALVCCAVMALVDGVIHPPYAVKSAVKLILFLGLPWLLTHASGGIPFKTIFRFRKRGFGVALGLGLGLYALILGVYFLLARFVDFSGIVENLSQNAGVNKGNFLFVSLYISFVNSLLEEFFFRGFVFLNLKPAGRSLAYSFSAGLFALYHVAMMTGWFSPGIYLLAILGLAAGGTIFNLLNEKLGTIYVSWLTHMFANFAINTIGFLLMA